MDLYALRKLALDYQVDPRSIKKEQAQPGSVRGMAGHRARAALASVELRGVQAAHAAEVHAP
jgi:hypothetical protein